MNEILIGTNGLWQYWAELNQQGDTIGEYGVCIDPECDCVGYIRYW